MPNYKHKLLQPLPDSDFVNCMNTGRFIHTKHKGLVAFLFYTACRISEALKMIRENFHREGNSLFIDVGERLKHSKKTEPLEILIESAFVDCIIDSYIDTKPKKRVWPYSRQTGWRIVKRTLPKAYPHYFRFNRITWLFDVGYTINQVENFTGLSLVALNYYVLRKDIKDMGRRMIIKK